MEGKSALKHVRLPTRPFFAGTSYNFFMHTFAVTGKRNATESTTMNTEKHIIVETSTLLYKIVPIVGDSYGVLRKLKTAAL